MPRFKRVFLMVLDSVGIGEAPDAAAYGDQGADTLGHIAEAAGGLKLPNLERLGLGHIKKTKGIGRVKKPLAYLSKMKEASAGKDTMTGHWEMMGLVIREPFLTYPNGFDSSLIKQLEAKTGRKVIGNKVASGTEIITELGERHMTSGDIIVYTSADSVMQIAAHEEVVPLSELYRICEAAREITKQEQYLIGRVIARPFTGRPGCFVRTANRLDYALKPFGRTVMMELKDHGFDVIALGKITDIFAGEGVTRSIRTTSNDDGIDKLIKNIDDDFIGLSFLNLVDFDSKYGHRRDPIGYAKALEAFDDRLPEVLQTLRSDDLLVITADHGNDPTHHGTDHTREWVPLIVYHKQITEGSVIPFRETFSDIGATIAENFHIPSPAHGKSFLHLV